MPPTSYAETTTSPTDRPTIAPQAPVIPPTPFPTSYPTAAPVVPPTSPTTLAPTTSPSTSAPTASRLTQLTSPPTGTPSLTTNQSPDDSNETEKGENIQTAIKSDGGQVTACSIVPQYGTEVSESLDVEYFLYLGDNADSTDSAAVQAIVDSLQVQLHTALADVAFDCTDFVTVEYTMVGLSNDGPGTDTVGAQCALDDAPADATSCRQVWAQISVTIWFLGTRRQLELSPFGSRTVFFQLVDWLNVAFDSLADPDSGIIQASFKGFVNLDGIDGTELAEPHVGVDPTAAFMGTAYTSDVGGLPFSYGQAAVVLAGLVLVLIVVFAIRRRRRNQQKYVEHVKQIDNRLDSSENSEMSPEVVDDDSLFPEENPLPEEFEVQLEDVYHDYRTCAIPTCKACLERKDPIFVSTDRNMDRNFSDRRRGRPDARNRPFFTVDDSMEL